MTEFDPIVEGGDVLDMPSEMGWFPSDLPISVSIDDMVEWLAEVYGIKDSQPLVSEGLCDIPMNIQIREYGVDETIKDVKNIFSPEVLSEWYQYSPDQRYEKYAEVANATSKALGIDYVEVVFEHLEEGCLGLNCGDGKIHLSDEFLKNPGTFILAIDTIVHETRHQYQSEAIRDPEKFGIDEKTWREWVIAQETYTTESLSLWDPVGYNYNALENDSNDFAKSIVREISADYCELLHGGRLNLMIARA